MYSERRVPMRVMIRTIQIDKAKKVAPVAQRNILASYAFVYVHQSGKPNELKSPIQKHVHFHQHCTTAEQSDVLFPSFCYSSTYTIDIISRDSKCRIIQPGGGK